MRCKAGASASGSSLSPTRNSTCASAQVAAGGRRWIRAAGVVNRISGSAAALVSQRNTPARCPIAAARRRNPIIWQAIPGRQKRHPQVGRESLAMCGTAGRRAGCPQQGGRAASPCSLAEVSSSSRTSRPAGSAGMLRGSAAGSLLLACVRAISSAATRDRKPHAKLVDNHSSHSPALTSVPTLPRWDERILTGGLVPEPMREEPPVRLSSFACSPAERR